MDLLGVNKTDAIVSLTEKLGSMCTNIENLKIGHTGEKSTVNIQRVDSGFSFLAKHAYINNPGHITTISFTLEGENIKNRCMEFEDSDGKVMFMSSDEGQTTLIRQDGTTEDLGNAYGTDPYMNIIYQTHEVLEKV